MYITHSMAEEAGGGWGLKEEVSGDHWVGLRGAQARREGAQRLRTHLYQGTGWAWQERTGRKGPLRKCLC